MSAQWQQHSCSNINASWVSVCLLPTTTVDLSDAKPGNSMASGSSRIVICHQTTPPHVKQFPLAMWYSLTRDCPAEVGDDDNWNLSSPKAATNTWCWMSDSITLPLISVWSANFGPTWPLEANNFHLALYCPYPWSNLCHTSIRRQGYLPAKILRDLRQNSS